VKLEVSDLRRRSVTAGVLLAAVAVTLSACGSDHRSDGSAHSTVNLITDGEITTCTHLPYRPFEFGRDGNVVGFDVDMIGLVAKKLRVKQSIVDTPFEAIQSGEALNAGKCDIAAAAMTITPERQQRIAFSAPYFDADQALLVKDASGISSLGDLRGRTLGVLSATTGKLYAEKTAPDGVQLKTYRDLTLQLDSVKSGEIAAAVNDIPVLLDYAKHNPRLRVAAQFDTGEHYGFAMSKAASHELAQTVDDVISHAKADGTYARIYRKWFGATPQ
jgi:polar amino acid transport system substrate-binding protein